MEVASPSGFRTKTTDLPMQNVTMGHKLALMLAIQRARESGYQHLAAALCELLRREAA
jgi:hypothetical protein